MTTATLSPNRPAVPGRIVRVRERPPYSGEVLQRLGIVGLHCGSGVNLHAGWLNTDLLPLAGDAGGRSVRGRMVACGEAFYLEHQAARPFPLAAGSVQRVLAEHFVEHLGLAEAVAWLAEMRRVLAPGGILRISTPDLEKYVRGYLDPEAAFYREHHARLAAMGVRSAPRRRAWTINQIFYGWGHRWIYDREELVHAALAAGFARDQVRPAAFRQSADPLLAELDLAIRNDESLYVELVSGQ